MRERYSGRGVQGTADCEKGVGPGFSNPGVKREGLPL